MMSRDLATGKRLAEIGPLFEAPIEGCLSEIHPSRMMTPSKTSPNKWNIMTTRDFYPEDLKKLGESISADDITNRSHFFDTIADNTNNHQPTKTHDGRIVLRLCNESDRNLVIELEKASGFTCTTVDREPMKKQGKRKSNAFK